MNLSLTYSAADCCDTADVLTAAATIWEQADHSFRQLLDYPAAVRRFKALAKRYGVLKAKEVAAGQFGHTEKYYEVAQFERVFNQLNSL